MQTRKRTPVAAKIAACLAVAALLAPALMAHPRRHPHRHGKAVIVVGKPRPVRTAVVINGRPHGILDMNVKPRATEVFVDGTFRGTCEALDGFPDKLYLLPGKRRIKLVTPDGIAAHRYVQVRAGVEIDVGLDLR